MARRTRWVIGIIVLIIGFGAVGIGAIVIYRQLSEQHARQDAVAIATQLGYQPQDLVSETKRCPGMLNFDERCRIYLLFQTTHTITEMDQLVAHLPCTNHFTESINGNAFANEFGNSRDELTVNGQILSDVQSTVPFVAGLKWYCPRAGRNLTTVNLYPISESTNRYTLRGQVITKNIATVTIHIE